MTLKNDKIDELIYLVNLYYPGWSGFGDSRFVGDERKYKVELSDKARYLINKNEMNKVSIP